MKVNDENSRIRIRIHPEIYGSGTLDFFKKNVCLFLKGSGSRSGTLLLAVGSPIDAITGGGGGGGEEGVGRGFGQAGLPRVE